MEARDRKFRQAAFVYLHVAILYEAAAYQMMRHGDLPDRFGPPLLWLIAGGVVAGAIVFGLLRYRNPWLPRIVWGLHALRIPALLNGAFFQTSNSNLPPSFYLTALIAVIVNLAFLARAGWDL